ncbi:MAG: hypothetical protein ACRD27_00455 [Terracidiphilus sp.]
MILKGLAAVALLVAFVQAPVAAAGQAGNSSGAALPNQPPSSIAAQQSAAGATAGATCPGGVCDEQPQHITVANPPPMVAVWPMHDRIAWAANLVLVVLAYAGIMLALATLKKIERQTRYGEKAAAAAADSAQAALLHAQAIVAAERPWVTVAAQPSRTVENGFLITATNRGRTPARIVAAGEQIEFAEDESRLPEDPQYGDGRSGAPFDPVILLPGESVEIKSFCRDDVQGLCQSDEKLKRVEAWEEKIFLYGKVTYRDLIAPRDEQIHETAWCCWYIHGRQKSGMVAAGSRKYNLHT